VIYTSVMLCILGTVVYLCFFQTEQTRWTRFANMFMPGLLASYTTCFGKAGVEMLETTTNKSPWDEVYVYIVIFLILLCGGCQVYMLNKSISSQNVSIAIPIYAATLIFLGTASGMVLFEASTTAQSLAVVPSLSESAP